LAHATRRRTVLGVLAGAPLCGALPARARAAEFSFKLAHPLAESHPTHLRLQEAASQIARDTDGRVQLRLFPNNQLGGEADLLSQVRSGGVEAYVIGGLVVSSLVPMAALDGVGFAFKNPADVWPAVDGKLGAAIRSSLLQAGLVPMSRVWDLGFRQITTSDRQIAGVDDLAGLKVRVPSAAAYTELFRSLGAAPASIQFGEVYTALQTHVVDGQENPLGLIVTSRFYEVQRHCSLSNHIWQGNWVLFNGRAWRGLPAPLQEVVEHRLNEAGIAQRKDLARLDESYRAAMGKAGMTINGVDSQSFRQRLSRSGYYARARRKFGEPAWRILEESVGGQLA
jgi:TRAP-type transport system periplasmic protein